MNCARQLLGGRVRLLVGTACVALQMPRVARSERLPLTQQDRERIAEYSAKAAAAGNDASSTKSPLPSGFIEAQSALGQRLAGRSRYSNSLLLQAAIPQTEMFSCGIATLACVLRLQEEFDAFKIMCSSIPEMQLHPPKPGVPPSVLAPDFDPHASALWVPGVLDVTNFTVCARRGEAPAERQFGFGTATGQEEEPGHTCERFRASCRQLGSGLSVAVSFDRKTAGQTGGGHWSPVAAYDEESDMVLVLDTAPRYGHYWAPVEVICAAMRTRNMHGQSRGWVEIRS